MIPSRQCLAFTAFAAVFPVETPTAVAVDFTGYLQSAVLAPQSDGRGGKAAWFNEFRIAAGEDLGAVRLDAAYEFNVYRAAPDAGTDTDWMDLQGDLSRGGRLESKHRVDRLQFAWSGTDGLDAVIGRQAISWGTTAYLTPADPFVPFAPSDTFREYRRGIDAFRLRAYPGALSEIELVLRPSRLQERQEFTALARVLTTRGNWEVSAWGGSLYGDGAAALGAAGEASDWAIRLEATARDMGKRSIGRGTIGAYRTLQVSERSLGLALEYQHDGLGASGSEGFPDLLRSDPYHRGEVQVPGRDQILARVAYQIHPLWEIFALGLWNLNTGNAILAPGFSHSVSDEATLTGGVTVNFGDPIPKEALPAEVRERIESITAHLSLTWYF